MATVSNEPSHPLAVGTWASGDAVDSKSERYLAKRLAAAGADYKGVAIVSFLLGALAVGLVWLAMGVLAEHWLVPGGLPRWARWVWLGAAAGTLVMGFVRWVVPLVRYRVNLVYAARAIEREFPDLHNDLVNAVLVRGDEEGTSPRMVRSLKRRAARQLSGLPADDTVVDRSLAVKLAYAVAALVGLACLYEVFAPKSLLTSSGRLLAPWTAVAAPSRVQIGPPQLSWRVPGDDRDALGAVPEGHGIDIRGGSGTIVRGRQLVVAADIRGLRNHEEPTISVRLLRDDGTVDAAAQPWQLVMQQQRSDDSPELFVAVLPDAARGLDRSLELSLTAGDTRTEPLRVVAVDAPSLLVQELRYEFPAYTRQVAEVVRWQGDIRAIEGTEVTLVAVGNRPLSAAWIDFGCDGRRDKPLLVNAGDPTRAAVTFDLRLDAAAQQTSYRLLFEPHEPAGGSRELVTEDLQHRIEVLPDMAPEISLEEPQKSPLRVPPDAPVRIRVRAVDPDFGLARVGLEVRLKDGPPGREIVLLADEKRGVFQGGSLLVPRQLGAQPGATLEYRGVAVDTRPQRPNETRTQWQALVIDERAPAREPPPEPQQGDQRRGGEGANEPQPGEGQGREGQNQAGQTQGRKGEPSKPGEDPNGQSKPGQMPGNEQGGQGNPSQGKGSQDQPSRDKGQRQAQGGEQAGADRKGDQSNPSGEQPGAGQQPSQQPGDNQSAGKQPGGQKGAGQQEGVGDKPPGQKAAGQKDKEAGQQAKQGRGEQKQPPRDTVAADGTNDGEAMERILEHRRQREQNNGQQPQDRAKPQDGQGKGGEQKDGQQKDGQQKDGQQKQGQQNDGRQNDQQPCADGNCGKEGCSTCNGGSKPGGGKPASSGASGQSGGGQAGTEGGQPSGQQSGSQQSGGQQQGEGGQQAGGQKPGEQQDGQPGKGGQQPGGQAGDGGQKGQPGGEPGGQGAAGGDAAGQQAGTKPGERAAGEPGAADKGSQPGEKPQPGAGDQAGAGKQSAGGDQQAKQPGEGQSPQGSETGDGAWGGGEAAPRKDRPALAGDREQRDMEWGDEDLSHARNAADLAVEHVRDAVAAGETDVLDALGWTREQAQAFVNRWRALRRLADSDDPRQRGEFERAVRSLGLRPRGVRSSRDVPTDVQGGQAEGRRSRPPSEYRDQVRAYLQGTSGE
jgi:hypothetical protein